MEFKGKCRGVKMKEKIKAIEEYLKYFPNDSNAKNNLKLCQYADELGLKLNGSNYPRVDWKHCLINSEIRAGKEYHLTNSTTKYKFNGEDTIIIWSAPAGRLTFVRDEYWWDIADEWDEFMNVLKSYNPLDYDELNDNYIYNLENGKRLINDYKKIVDDFMEKVNNKIKKVELEKKKKQLELLQKELEESK
jgi:hypothetical protein